MDDLKFLVLALRRDEGTLNDFLGAGSPTEFWLEEPVRSNFAASVEVLANSEHGAPECGTDTSFFPSAKRSSSHLFQTAGDRWSRNGSAHSAGRPSDQTADCESCEATEDLHAGIDRASASVFGSVFAHAFSIAARSELTRARRRCTRGASRRPPCVP